MQQKKVLAICYSQTGQLSQIAQNILAPLRASDGVKVHVEYLKPVQSYPFPWPFFRFFDAFPESAHMVAPELEPLTITETAEFDLVIVFYQVWFLAPSLPITGFMKHPLAARLLKDKPVVTVIGCRNMWLMAQEKMKTMLTEVGAKLVDNVVLMDKTNMAATFITTPRWFLTGKKEGFWGMPAAGIPAQDIAQTTRFGRAIVDALTRDAHHEPMLTGLLAVQANPNVLVSEKAGTKSFYIWGKLLRKIGAPHSMWRVPVLAVYFVFLLTLIITIVPVSLTLQRLARPFLKTKLAALKAQFEQPSGSGTERMKFYE
ncbi:MAG: dialkylresorcinol condensing enzyme [Formosimonas sp.]